MLSSWKKVQCYQLHCKKDLKEVFNLHIKPNCAITYKVSFILCFFFCILMCYILFTLWSKIFNFLTPDFFIRLMGVLIVTNPSTLPYKQVCSKCKISDIYQQPSNGLYFCNLCKVAATCAFDIHINSTIEIVDGPPCIPMSKLLGCFPCSNSKKMILW